MPTPRVAAVHDLSGFGRCSLTIVMPALSAMGVQCCPVPTAFLSTHTGGFTGNTFLDLTDQMAPITGSITTSVFSPRNTPIRSAVRRICSRLPMNPV